MILPNMCDLCSRTLDRSANNQLRLKIPLFWFYPFLGLILWCLSSISFAGLGESASVHVTSESETGKYNVGWVAGKIDGQSPHAVWLLERTATINDDGSLNITSDKNILVYDRRSISNVKLDLSPLPVTKTVSGVRKYIYYVRYCLNPKYEQNQGNFPILGTGKCTYPQIAGAGVVVSKKPTVSAYFQTTELYEGSSTKLFWSSTNASACNANGLPGVSGVSGSITWSAPSISEAEGQKTFEYTVTCNKSGVSASANASVVVRKPPVLEAPSSSSTGDYDISWRHAYRPSRILENGNIIRSMGVHPAGTIPIRGKGDGTYKYELQLCGRVNNSTVCNTALTKNVSVQLPLPPKVTGVTLSNVEGTYDTNGSLTVKWNAANYATKYEVSYTRQGTPGSQVATATSTNVAIDGLVDGVWEFRVRGCNRADKCQPSYSSAVTKTVMRMPGNVTNFRPSENPSYDGSLSLKWDHASNTVTSYRVRHKSASVAYPGGPHGWFSFGEWDDIGYVNQLPVDQPYGKYTYEIEACNPRGCRGMASTVFDVFTDTSPTITAPSISHESSYRVGFTMGTMSGKIPNIWIFEQGMPYLVQKVDWTGERVIYSNSKVFSYPKDGTRKYYVKACINSTTNQSGEPQPTTGICKETSVKTVVIDLPEPTISASFAATTINEGGSTTFSWDSTLADGCSATGPGISGVSGPSGQVLYDAPNTLINDVVYTVKLKCSGNGGDTTKSIDIKIKAVNDNPTISGIATKTINEDAGEIVIPFVVGDEETPSSITVTATHNNNSLIEYLQVEGGSSLSPKLKFKTKSNQHGTATITITVNDGTGQTVVKTFSITVKSVNDEVTLSEPDDVELDWGDESGYIDIRVNDFETIDGEIAVTATASDNSIVRSILVTPIDGGGKRRITIYPKPKSLGSEVVRVAADDGDGSVVFSEFTFSVVDEPAYLILDEQNDNGDFTVAWESARDFVKLTEEFKGVEIVKNTSNGSSGSINVTKSESGTYKYTLEDCYQPVNPIYQPVCIERDVKYINVELAPLSLTASYSPSFAAAGSEITLSWDSRYAKSCSASDFPQVEGITGSISLSAPAGPSSISNVETLITCTGNGGSVSAVAKLRVSTDTNSDNDDIDSEDIHVGDDYLGLIKATARVSNGGALVSDIPIDITPGINKVQPSLAISYNSNAKNSIVGWGWGLKGLSSISRCPANHVKDGYSSSINQNDPYKFCINGERLVEVSEREYRTEDESFVRIKSFGGDSRAPDYWVVEYKNGSSSTYGNTANSRLTDAGVEGIFKNRSWSISEFKDLSGNKMDFIYEAGNGLAGTGYSGSWQRLKRIEYTKNEDVNLGNFVEFEYDLRPDVREFYTAGAKVLNLWRLKSIDSNSTWKYYFTYQDENSDQAISNVPSVSKLEYIERCVVGEAEICGPAKKIIWNQDASGVSQSEKIDYNYVGIGDFNGDGKVQGLVMKEAGFEDSWSLKAVQISNPYLPSHNVCSGYCTFKGRPQVWDMDSDGYDDVVLYSKELDVVVFRGSPNGFTVSETWASIGGAFNGTNTIFTKYKILDLNGDNLPDLIAHNHLFGIKVKINDGHGAFGDWNEWFGPYLGRWGEPAPSNGSYSARVGGGQVDLNGDRLVDLWDCFAGSCYGDSSRVLFNTGGGVEATELWRLDSEEDQNLSGAQTFLADVNGDSLPDWIAFKGQSEELLIRLNTGHGFESAAKWLDLPYRGSELIRSINLNVLTESGATEVQSVRLKSISFADINRDGCADIVVNNESQGKVYLSYSSCTDEEGFTEFKEWVTDEDLITSPDNDPDRALYSLDIDFDGVAELVGSDYYRKTSFLTRKVQAFEDYYSLSDAESGSGRVGRIEASYEPLMDSMAYSVDLSENFYGMDRGDQIFNTDVSLKGAVLIVTSLKDDTTPYYNKTYSYKNYLANAGGWGGFSFGEVQEVVNYVAPQHGESISDHYLRKVSRYNRKISDDFSLNGKLSAQDVYIKGLNLSTELLTKRSRYSWKVRTYDSDIDKNQENGVSSPHYYPYIYESSQEEWDLSGAKISTSVTHFYLPTSNDCAPLTEEQTEAVIKAKNGDAIDTDVDAYGVVKFQQTVVCDDGVNAASFVLTGTSISKTENKITDNTWVVGLPKEVKEFAYVGASVAATDLASVRTTEFAYFENGMLETKTEEPENDRLKLITTYGYNQFGNKKSVLQEWVSFEKDGLNFGNSIEFEVSETYENGSKKIVSTNPLEQNLTVKTDNRFASLAFSEDVNGFETSNEYDALGRIAKQYMPGNLTVEFSYKKCIECFPYNQSAAWYAATKSSGQSAVYKFYDKWGREVGDKTRNADGDYVYTLRTYDGLGRLQLASLPFEAGDNILVEEFEYDIFNRMTRTIHPDSTETTIAYNGRVKVRTNREFQVQKTITNGVGWNVEVVDNANTKIKNTYTNFGDIDTTIVDDNELTKIDIDYDILGRKIQISDPNSGVTKYTVNSLGLVSLVEDANGQITYSEYDQLKRLVGRTDALDTDIEKTHRWVYDSALHGKGKLHYLEGYDSSGRGYKEVYTYQNIGLVQSLTKTINGQNYTSTYSYDDYYRSNGMTYPGGFASEEHYNAYGYVDSVYTVSGKILWQLVDVDAAGNAKEYIYGNGVVTNKTYEPYDGRIETIISRANDEVIQNQEYKFSSMGNLEERIDYKFGTSEYFCYDNMNRLTSARIEGCSEADEDFKYDNLGNITSKNGINDYAYDSGRPNAVSYFNGSNFKYDSAGRFKSGGGKSVIYATVGKPELIEGNGAWSKFIYDVAGNRIERTDSDGRSVTYLGGLEIHEDGLNTRRIYSVGDFANYIESTGVTSENYFEYLHRDHLGSVVARTRDERLESSEYYAFSAWGLRLDQAWDGIELGATFVPKTDSRGFTNHEHIDLVGLVHMGGRVYDPESSRFLTPDPFIQAPNNTQSYNRYSYVFNNPLSFTDPSGYITDVNVPEEPDLPEMEIEEVVVIHQGAGNVNDYNAFFNSFRADMDAAAKMNTIDYITNLGSKSLYLGMVADSNVAGGALNGIFMLDTWFTYVHDVEALLTPGDEFGNKHNRYNGKELTLAEQVKLKEQLFILLVGAPVDGSVVVTLAFAKVSGGVLSLGRGLFAKFGSKVTKSTGKLCFAKGTLVSTPLGDVPIEELQPGDEVYSYDLETGEKTVEAVTQTHRGRTLTWIKINVGEDELLATPEHPFWDVKNSTWIHAEEVTSGTVLLLENGNSVSVSKVQRVANIDYEETYNLTVSNEHNYFVGEDGYLTHNQNPTPAQLPDRVIYNQNGIRIWHNFGNVNPGPGTLVDHAPIHFHSSYQGKEYRSFSSGANLKDSKALPKAVQDVFSENKSRFNRIEKRIGKWFKSLPKSCG